MALGRKRDAALALIGAWVMGSIFMAVVATQNFYLIDRLLAVGLVQGFNDVVASLGSDVAREFMRYVSSELNRLFFIAWGIVQIGMGALLLWLVWHSESKRVRVGACAMCILAVVITLGLTPPIVSVGRALDFVPRDPPPPELNTFGLIHAAYSLVDIAKTGLSLLVAFWIHRNP